METKKYKVDVAKDGWKINVTNKETGKVQTYWGDPHAKESSGRNVDFKGNLTVKLDDGNELHIETADKDGKPVKDGDNGPTYSNKVTLGNPKEGYAKIENIGGSKPLEISKLGARPNDFGGYEIILDKNGNFLDPLDGKPLTQADMNEMDAINKRQDAMNKRLFG